MLFKIRTGTLSGHDESSAKAIADRVGRGEQAEARAGNSAARVGSQLELSRRLFKTWSESEPSAAFVQPLASPPRIY